ncbi:hypothetical protein ACS0VN_22410 [Salmonella enterica subsp. enterica serovar Paratyphi A]
MVVASPVLAAIYTRLGSKGKDLTMPMKFYARHVSSARWVFSDRRRRRDVVLPMRKD